MDYSAANTVLWAPWVQVGIISGILLLANVLRRKITIVRKSLMPTAVLGGFLLLFFKYLGVVNVTTEFLEILTYHMLGIGFVAMSLRIPEKKSDAGALIGSKSGALIVSTYLVQAIAGLIVSLGLAYTIMPVLFKASGILLPMAYGQGPGQANNVGATYEALGMAGGRSFGMSLAASGYLCACIVGVIFLNIYTKKGIIKRESQNDIISGSVTIDTFQDENEIPIEESVDKLSVQVALIMLVYLLTYLVTWGAASGLTAIAPGIGATVSTLLWGFNFIIGSVVAMGCRVLFAHLRKVKVMNRQYQNNYLLNRISGLAFDIMIVAGIASINISDLKGMVIPFVMMAVAGGIITFVYLKYMCNRMYPGYEQEGFFSMYGMLTGTISSGVLLLRELDPGFKTPAATNLVTGSSFGILFGAPVLLLVSMAAKSDIMVFVVLLLAIIYLAFLLFYIFKVGKKK